MPIDRSIRHQFHMILQRLTPDASRYRRYRRQVRALEEPAFCREFFAGTALIPRRTRWVTSVLFGREYLVLEVERGALRGFYPSLDLSVLRFDTPVFAGVVPPLVIVPETGAAPDILLPALEHEFIHVNQVLLDRLARIPDAPVSAPVAAEYFVSRARAEYEAAFLRLVQWPGETPPGPAVPLESRAMLQGFCEALERTLLLMVAHPTRPSEFHRWLDGIRHWPVFRGATSEGADESWLRASIGKLLSAALERLVILSPGIELTPGYRSLCQAVAQRRNRRAVTAGIAL